MSRARRCQILITALIAVTIAACGDGATSSAPGTSSPGAASAAPTTAAGPTTAAEPATAPVPDPSGGRPAPDSPDVGALAEGLNQAGMRLFLAAAEGSADDVVLSPLSIGVAFGMADVGATGETAEALESLFGYPVEGEARLSAFNTLLQRSTDVGEPVVRIANRQFPDQGFAVEPDFDEALATWFGAAAQPLPLQEDPEGSRRVINDYVADRTEDLIPELVPDGMITPQSVLIIVNALYLQADWRTPFGKYPTEDAPFTRLDGSGVTVPLMNDQELFGPAVEGDGYVAAERPYDGDALSMLIIVPDEGTFEAVQSRLAAEGDGGLLAEVDAGATDQAVDLYLPRFTSTSAADLTALIAGSLGVEGIFDVPGYDGIAPGIVLDSAVHAADIEVDEQGTVAAAATALGFDESGPGEPDLVVRADRPFLYVIRHLPTGAVLFVGRVMDPSA